MSILKRMTYNLLFVLFINLPFVPIGFSATAPDIQYVKINGITVNNNESITINDFLLGDTFSFEIAVRNNGQYSPADFNNITVSFPEFKTEEDKNNVGYTAKSFDLNYGEFFDTEAEGGDGYANYVMVESQDTNGWESSETNTLSLSIKPKDYLDFMVLYRSAASSQSSWEEAYLTRNPTDGFKDCLAIPAYFITVKLEAPPPDLIVSSCSINKNTIFPRDSIDASASIKNIGAGSAADSELHYFLSKDSNPETSEYIDDDYVKSLDPGESSNESQLLTTFSSVYSLNDTDYEQSWYVIFKADADGDEIEENNENNNVAYKTVIVTRPTLVNYTCYPETVKPGDTITFNYYINNPLSESRVIGLGASIRKDGTSELINDFSNDVKETVEPGLHWVSRPFKVPDTVTPGSYDLLWGLHSDTPSTSTFLFDDRERLRKLNIVAGSGQVTITVKNVANGSTEAPGEDAIVKRYDNSNDWNPLDEQKTDANGVATFNGLDYGTYNFEVWYTPPNQSPAAAELWGSKQHTVESATSEMTIDRTWPTLAVSDSEPISLPASIAVGEVAPITIKVANPQGGQFNTRVRVFIDKDKTEPYDLPPYYGSPEEYLLTGTDPFPFNCTTAQIDASGTYHVYYRIEAQAPSGWVITDQNYWGYSFEVIDQDPASLVTIPDNWEEIQGGLHFFSLMGNYYVAKLYIPFDLKSLIPVVGKINSDGEVIPIGDKDELKSVLTYALLTYTADSMLQPAGADYWLDFAGKLEDLAKQNDPSNANASIVLLTGGKALLNMGIAMIFTPAAAAGTVSILKVTKNALTFGSFLMDLYSNLYFFTPENNEMSYALQAQHLLDPQELLQIGLEEDTLKEDMLDYASRGLSTSIEGLKALKFLVGDSNDTICGIGTSIAEIIAGKTSLPEFLGEFHLNSFHEISAASLVYLGPKAVNFTIGYFLGDYDQLGTEAKRLLASINYHANLMAVLARSIVADIESIDTATASDEVYRKIFFPRGLLTKIILFYDMQYEVFAATHLRLKAINDSGWAGDWTVSDDDVETLRTYVEEYFDYANSLTNELGYLSKAMSYIYDFYADILPDIAPISDESTIFGQAYCGPTPTLIQGTPPVIWSLVDPPSQTMTIDTATGVVNWSNPNETNSPYEIMIQATNNEGFDTESWMLTVTQAPVSPLINLIDNDSIQENRFYTGPVPTLNAGSEPVIWSLPSGPSGMTINNSTGVVSWPNPTTSGSPFTVVIEVSNSAGSDTEPFLLTVTPTVVAPTISPIANQSCRSGNTYTGPTPSVSGTRPILWSIFSGPAGMTIDSNTGVIGWTNPTVSGSPYNITIKAANSAGYYKQDFQLTVETNTELPVISGIIPESGMVETHVKISGINFLSSSASNHITFSPDVVANNILSWKDNEIIFIVPYGAQTGCVTVTTDNGTSNCVNFTVVILPQTDIYLSPEGDDTSGDGSISNPYQTLSKGIDYLEDNGNLWLRGGEYLEAGNVPITINKPMLIRGHDGVVTIGN